MNNYFELTQNTKDYELAFKSILDEMVFQMTNAKLTNSISHNFIVQMIPHHKAAIEMSKNILKYIPIPKLQKIAHNIIEEQTKSIDNMCKIKDACTCITNLQQDLCDYQKQINPIWQTMFCGMSNACISNNLNKTFITQMIPHHEGAIKMSRIALQYHICEGLYPILSAIIISQERGIIMMQEILKNTNNFCNTF